MRILSIRLGKGHKSRIIKCEENKNYLFKLKWKGTFGILKPGLYKVKFTYINDMLGWGCSFYKPKGTKLIVSYRLNRVKEFFILDSDTYNLGLIYRGEYEGKLVITDEMIEKGAL